LVPPLALLAAPFYAQLWFRRKHVPSVWWYRPALSYSCLGILVIGFSISHWLFLARHRKPLETARYLLEHSGPNDRVFIWGRSASDVYLHARRRPACRYFLTSPLTGFVFGGELRGRDTRDRIVPGAWANLEADFRQHPPVYIADHYSEPNAQYPVRDFPILAKLLAERYEPVAQTAQGIIYRIR
jgi:hypothetical protein